MGKGASAYPGGLTRAGDSHEEHQHDQNGAGLAKQVGRSSWRHQARVCLQWMSNGASDSAVLYTFTEPAVCRLTAMPRPDMCTPHLVESERQVECAGGKAQAGGEREGNAEPQDAACGSSQAGR